MLSTESRPGVMHPPKDVERGLHKPQPEKIPTVRRNTVRKIIAGIMTTATIASYSVYSKEVNNFVGDVFSGVNPFPTAEASEPTSAVDEYVIPEGLGIEDNTVRQSVEVLMENPNGIKNPFGLDITEVKNYLLTGETKDCKTFEVLNDANDKPAFVVVKGGENGFIEENVITIKNAVERLNKIDPTIISMIRDKYGLNFISFGFNNYKFFENKPDYGATFMRGGYGGIILINPTTLKNHENNEKQNTFNAISFILGESRAIYGLKYSNDGGENTTAPDRFDDKIGTDKSLYILSLADKWYKSNLIDEIEKIVIENIGNASLSYYSNN